MRHTRRLAALVLFAIVTVEFGGWSLLGFLTSSDSLTPFEEQFFRAGHGHAGVLLVLALAFLLLLEKTSFQPKIQIGLAITLLVGVLANQAASSSTWRWARNGPLLRAHTSRGPVPPCSPSP